MAYFINVLLCLHFISFTRSASIGSYIHDEVDALLASIENSANERMRASKFDAQHTCSVVVIGGGTAGATFAGVLANLTHHYFTTTQDAAWHKAHQHPHKICVFEEGRNITEVRQYIVQLFNGPIERDRPPGAEVVFSEEVTNGARSNIVYKTKGVGGASEWNAMLWQIMTEADIAAWGIPEWTFARYQSNYKRLTTAGPTVPLSSKSDYGTNGPVEVNCFEFDDITSDALNASMRVFNLLYNDRPDAAHGNEGIIRLCRNIGLQEALYDDALSQSLLRSIPKHILQAALNSALAKGSITRDVMQVILQKAAVAESAVTAQIPIRQSAGRTLAKFMDRYVKVYTGVRVVKLDVKRSGQHHVHVLSPEKGVVEVYKATHKVVLAAGAIMTPVILQQSGIGNCSDLEARFGIECQVHQPWVGQNLRESPLTFLAYFSPVTSSNTKAGVILSAMIRQLIKWEWTKYEIAGVGTIAFMSISDHNDTFVGQVQLRSEDGTYNVFAEPVVTYNFYPDNYYAEIVQAFKATRAMMQNTSAPYIEIFPNDYAAGYIVPDTDAAIESYWKQRYDTESHTMSSVAIGKALTANFELMHANGDIECNILVIDNSAMPDIMKYSHATCATAMVYAVDAATRVAAELYTGG